MSTPSTLDNPDLGAIYRALDPLIDGLERHRRWNIAFFLIVSLFAAPGAGIAAVATALYYTEGRLALVPFGPFILFITALAAGITTVLAVYRLADRDYRRFCKRRYNREFARILRMRYDPLGSFFVDELLSHYVLPPFKRCLTEDSLEFRHRGRRIRMQEVIFTRVILDEVHMFNPQSFSGKRGLVVRVPSRRWFNKHVVVVPKRWIASDRDRLRFPGLHYYERAPFGNRKFADKYFVMTQDPVEAHLIFDPAFIERIMAFETAVGARSLSLSFREDGVVIYAHHSHNFLELGHLFQRPRLERARQIIAELQALTALIDSLELNKFTGV